jgi:hypothetical protein
METSFPRGTSSRTSRSTTAADAVVAENNKATDKKSSNIGSSAKKKRSADVLFGALSDSKVDEKTRSKQQASASKRSKKKETSDGTTTAASLSSSSHTSLMPLGGGGVVLSTTAKAATTSSTDATTTTITTTSFSSDNSYFPSGYIESLSFGKLHSGVALWAVVREVHDDLAVFSLPHQWTAYMLRGQEVDALSSNNSSKMDSSSSSSGTPCNVLLQKGQMLAVKILQAVQESSSNKKGSTAGPKRRIQVTCLPQKINPPSSAMTVMKPHAMVRGQVTSIEDFGLLVDLGYARRGFLPFAEIQGDYYCTPEEKEELDSKQASHKNKNSSSSVAHAHCLLEGRIMDFVVGKTTTLSTSSSAATTTTAAGSVVPLTLPRPHDMIAEYFLPGSRPTDLHKPNNNKSAASSALPSLQELQPGTLVRARVEALVRNGLCVSFGGSQNSVYRGAIEVQHLGGFWIPKSRDGNSSHHHGSSSLSDKDDWKSIFDIYRNVTARIIAIDARTKLIRLTLLPHLLQGHCRSLQNGNMSTMTAASATTTPRLLPEVGMVVEGATVVRLDPGIVHYWPCRQHQLQLLCRVMMMMMTTSPCKWTTTMMITTTWTRQTKNTRRSRKRTRTEVHCQSCANPFGKASRIKKHPRSRPCTFTFPKPWMVLPVVVTKVVSRHPRRSLARNLLHRPSTRSGFLVRPISWKVFQPVPRPRVLYRHTY